MDALTSVLGSIHLKSSLLSQLDAAGDWSIDCEDPRGITAYCILSGGCWFAPTTGEVVRLETGDILLLPEWHEHRLFSSPHVPAIPVSEVARRFGVQIWDPDQPFGEIYYLRHGPDGEDRNHVRILVILLRAAEREQAILTSCLPKVWRFNPSNERIASSVSLAVRFLSQELAQKSVGFGAASHRLAEFLFVQLLREVVETRADGVRGWLKGLSSPALSCVLVAMHRMPDARWTIDQLAALARMSRSTFCAEFSHVIGVSPITYARNIRLQAAAGRLERGHSVKEASVAAGYATPYGFQKAFSQAFGSPPISWRRR
jgi:AraC-like DNA-binding protein